MKIIKKEITVTFDEAEQNMFKGLIDFAYANFVKTMSDAKDPVFVTGSMSNPENFKTMEQFFKDIRKIF